MKTNDIMLKLQSNNNKLETVLSKKNFTGDVKNLLLSMLYQIASSYNDYENIKVNVENKNKFVEDIVKIINKCENIELVSPSSEEGMKFTERGITSVVDTYQNTIKVFPTEKAMLFAIFKMNDNKMYLDEEYNVIRISLPEMLNEGRDINNIEIIRDFNAWSWNTLASEISNVECNLIYQNLQILLGFEFLNDWMKQEKQKKILKKLEERLKAEYNNSVIEELLELIYRLSIIICIQRNANEKSRLQEEKEWDEKELERISDKARLVEELTKNKKQKAKEIEKIDKMLNDNALLKEEFDKRNKKLSEYKKIFSIENLAGTLKKERKNALKEIAECNKLLDAKKYVKTKEKLEKDVDLLKDAKSTRNKEKYKIEIQNLFLECVEEKIRRIDKIEQKKELIELFNILRYYNFIVYDENRFVKDVEEIKSKREEAEEMTIRRMFELKILNPITKHLYTDIEIVKPILKTRIMNLENISISAANEEEVINVEIHDGKVLESDFQIENVDNIIIKKKKNTKLFAK